MNKKNLTQKQKGYIGLCVMAVLSAVTVLGSESIYKAISKIGQPSSGEILYDPGTYTAAAKGYGGDVVVTVTVSATAIDQIELEGDDETEEIGIQALKKLQQRIMEKQSAKIDSVSGATMTSKAVKEALTDCLKQAAK